VGALSGHIPASADLVRSLPKAEVHVHLEGCFEVEHVQELAIAAGEDLLRPADELFTFRELSDFLEFLSWQCALVRTPEQVAEAAYRFAAREAEAGTGYADVIVNPTHWPAWRDRLPDFVRALDEGFSAAERDGLTPVGLCISLLRQQSAAEAAALVDRLADLNHPRVVALSIDGNEATAGRTSTRFADAFARARELGLRATVHAGESSGPEGVQDAIRILGADRVDHGFRATEDPDLVSELVERGTHLALCPWSNISLGHFPDRASHPLDELRRQGVSVSVNTDDPALFGVRLDEEYAATAEAYGWDAGVLASVAEASIAASFCDEAARADLAIALSTWVERNVATDTTPSAPGG
jgi:adenosine deaminase